MVTTPPVNSNEWILVKQGLDANIGLTRHRRVDVTGEIHSTHFDFTVQEQNDIVLLNAVSLTIQYNFLGSVTQQGFYPYDFWIMCGIIGGCYIIFYSAFVALSFCALQFLNIKEHGDEYEAVNEKQ